MPSLAFKIGLHGACKSKTRHDDDSTEGGRVLLSFVSLFWTFVRVAHFLIIVG